MAKRKAGTNPFYVLLVIVGIAFLLTVCAYTVMTVTADQAARSPDMAPRESGLLAYMAENGGTLMLWELIALGLATVGAIATDRFWAARGKAKPTPGATQP